MYGQVHLLKMIHIISGGIEGLMENKRHPFNGGMHSNN